MHPLKAAVFQISILNLHTGSCGSLPLPSIAREYQNLISLSWGKSKGQIMFSTECMSLLHHHKVKKILSRTLVKSKTVCTHIQLTLGHFQVRLTRDLKPSLLIARVNSFPSPNPYLLPSSLYYMTTPRTWCDLAPAHQQQCTHIAHAGNLSISLNSPL